ncbi:unnamed protein product [Adineta steineri]|uniref:DUF4371 domain-containing protein n=1 Tax=Adineta steineri TaxID=433720 RepID=A0A814DGG0_9BILA|nr:unnamed protein product [Adineta steineri]CAF1191200.1 unnamed protein product [Adineta steineri]
MIVAPLNPNVVVVSMIPSGCMKSEFDSNYPIHLNGIISQEEFRQSISNINGAIGSNKCLAILIIIFVVSLLGGIALMIAGPLSATKTSNVVLRLGVFLGIGMGLLIFGMICTFVGCCVMQSQRMKRVRQAIVDESAKYSARSSRPSSWRLHTDTIYTGGYSHDNNQRMASKRSSGSILDFFSKKSKAQAPVLSTEEIPLVDFTILPTSSRGENTEISSATKIYPLIETSNLTNLNNVSENDLEHESQDEVFDTSNISSNTDNPIPLLQPANLVTSCSSDQKELISKCDLSCCNSSNPYHPVREDELALTVVDKRSCQKKWFSDYPWLTFCKVHEKSNLHRDSIYVVNQQGKRSVREQLTLATQQQQEQRRQALIIQISCIMFLLRQGLALRGHSDENSNLIQLLKLRTIDNHFLKQWIDEKNYLSHDIINELCKEIYLTIIRDIVKEISNREWFSLICDETTDQSTRSQLCITIRSVDNNYNVFEDVIGLYEISRQNAPTIVEAILDTLTRCGLDIANCRGQSYDGASNMSGIYGGVSALILKQQGKAMYVHCNAHCLDLAIQDLTSRCTTICSCLSFAKDIIDFIRRSPKRLSIIKETSNQITMPYTTLTPLCPTRWTMRAGSCSSLLENYGLVQETLYTISDEKDSCGIKANAYLILIDTEKVSRIIQGSSCCLQDVLCAAETVINYFIRIGDDNHFNLFYNGVINDSEGLTEKPVLPRQRRPPKRYDSSSRVPDFTTCEEFYHRQYIEALDIVVNMLRVRFTQSNFKLLCDVEKFILNVSNNPVYDPDDLIQEIMEFCDGDIDIQRLKAEVHMIYDFFKSTINTNQMKIKQITKISTICEILNSCNVGKQMFREFDKLIKLHLTLPVSTGSAERAFSTLNRLKTVLRNSMTQSRLNHCLLANIYKEKLDEIDPYQIMSKFIASNTNRQALFGSIV